jgi:hypothetical protein
MTLGPGGIVAHPLTTTAIKAAALQRVHFMPFTPHR